MRKFILAGAALWLVVATAAVGEEAKPAESPAEKPKCSAIASKKFPAAPAAASSKLGRVAACVPAKECTDSSDKGKAALAASFCATNNYELCSGGSCDQATFSCQPEFRAKETKGMKLSKCVARPSKITCPKEGEEICLCDLEIEAKGALSCGCACKLAPTPTPTAR